jgi:GT2 family glycosyltransferase
VAEESGQPQNPVRTTALIVSHNRAPALRQCLEALERSEQREQIEIVVVDNGSTEGSAELQAEFPAVRFIPLPRNFGLTKALNIGVRTSTGEFVLLLHEDTAVAPDTVAILAAVLESRVDIGAVCPLLVDEQGAPAPQIRELPTSQRPVAPFRPADPSAGEQNVQYALGAALMFRSFFLRAMRQIDERYGLYGSDAELCAQVRRSGKKILLVCSTRVTHHLEQAPASAAALRSADLDSGVAAYLGKHFGFIAGLKARLFAIFRSLATLRLSQLKHLLSGQKIDGSQR